MSNHDFSLPRALDELRRTLDLREEDVTSLRVAVREREAEGMSTADAWHDVLEEWADAAAARELAAHPDAPRSTRRRHWGLFWVGSGAMAVGACLVVATALRPRTFTATQEWTLAQQPGDRTETVSERLATATGPAVMARVVGDAAEELGVPADVASDYVRRGWTAERVGGDGLRFSFTSTDRRRASEVLEWTVRRAMSATLAEDNRELTSAGKPALDRTRRWQSAGEPQLTEADPAWARAARPAGKGLLSCGVACWLWVLLGRRPAEGA